VTAPDARVVLNADPVRLSQVLSNLLTNAAKYTDPGGRVEILVRTTAGHCSISVRDSGIGLAPDALESVFTMFAQERAALDRSEGGLGIGLALVKGLVELHGGRVEARSEGLGQGSEFTVHIPLPSPPEVPVQAAVDAVAPDGRVAAPRGARILLAEDNADARESLATWLRLSGHTVSVAGDGVEALAAAERERPEVMVLDIGMPRLNGYDLARRLRALDWTAGVLLIAMTGWGQDDDQRRAREAGFDVHLTKPFDPEQLLELLARHPDAGPAQPAS
jgi:CheY-like chemotaxis protein